MKKLIICSFAFAALVLAGCNSQPKDINVEEDASAIITEMQEMIKAGDIDGLKSVISKSQQEIEDLIKKGLIDEAQAYAEKLEVYIDTNKAAIDSVSGGEDAITNLFSTISSIPDASEIAKEKAEEMVSDAKDKLEDAASDAKDKIDAAAADVKDKAEELKNDAKEKIDNAASDAKDKIEGAASDAKEKIENAIESGKQKSDNAADDAANKLKNVLKK